ncbi:hypothetical protein TSUD_133930 [Trifolium subterraneum]|uniref:Uncharacterized protein n=1 Tax=Trifolium subterraneum TaxID=3900 RepID=A0A2Z6PED7_TRISU|nr:hypothetical protein TSUD_133930 [Trifolium subterraneum]
MMPVIDQGFTFLGMQYTSASFASALMNAVPSVTFVLAVIFRIERVNLKQIRSIAKSITLKKYPAEMSLSTLICLIGALQSSVVALVAERHSGAAVWAIGWDFRLYGPLYTFHGHSWI